MMTQNIPYFMNNEHWYYYDYIEMKYKLTNQATDEARESYKRFYSYEEKIENNR